MNWLPMHSGHPLIIHLPLIALPLAVTVDLLEAARADHRLRPLGTALWVLGLLGGMLAAGTGLLAYGRVDHSDAAHAVMTLHRNIALSTLGLLVTVGLARWRWSGSKLVAATGVLALVGLVGTAYLGGELVFRHAVGLPTTVLEQVMEERGADEMDLHPDMGSPSTAGPGDTSRATASAAMAGDTSRPTAHTHHHGP